MSPLMRGPPDMEAQAISYFLAVFQLHFQVIVVVVAVVTGGGGVIDTGRVAIFPNRAIHSFIHLFRDLLLCQRNC
jgi:hypothetical protein